MAERATLMSRSVRVAEDEAKWLSAAADKGGVSQNDLIRLGLHRLRKELGAANRIKPETLATAKASKYKLAPPRAAAGKAAAAAKTTSPATPSEKTASANAATRPAGKRARKS
jgi:hypothetical protein